MTNYKMLIETLRWTANEYKGSIMDEADKDTVNAAADAIEELQALLGEAENSVERWKDMFLTKHEPKHGEWIRNDNGTYSCSLCKSWIPDEQHYYAEYCLYCGAKMSTQSNDSNALDALTDAPIITPCRGCDDYDGYGGCKSNGGCGAKMGGCE